MPIVRTISVVKGKGSIAHNNRDFVAENVIEERIEDDISYKKESLEDAYEHLFGDAIREYNERQKRADRKIDGARGYMDKLRNSKNGEKLFYENVIQVGNMHDCKVGSAEGEKAKEILDKYMRDFQERNPNLYVFNAVMHLDEQTPHLHIDYIPIAHGYKQGLKARNSLDKALGEQGIEGKSNKYENRTNKWQEREKNHIAEIMHEHGFERAEEKGIKAPKLSVGAYKAAVSEIENQVQQLPNHIQTKSIPFVKDRVSVSVADLELLERSAKLSEVHENALQEVYSAERTKLKEMSFFRDQAKDYMDGAKKDKVQWSVLKSEQEKLYNEQLALNDRCAELEKENKKLKKTIKTEYALIKTLKGDLSSQIEKATKPLLEEIEMLKTENKSLKERLWSICQSMTNALKAINNLKFGKAENGYRLELTKKQSRLFEAIENYVCGWLQTENQQEMVKDIKEHINIAEGISNEIKALEPKVSNRGFDR